MFFNKINLKQSERIDNMSQAKVDKYKQEKKNRKRIIAKQKRDRFFGSCAFAVVILAFVGYIGYSVYDSQFKKDTANETEVATYSLSEEEVSSVWSLATSEEETTSAPTDESEDTTDENTTASEESSEDVVE